MRNRQTTRPLHRWAVLVTAAALTCDSSASILWDFSTTDGFDTISGQLTTDGSLPDLAGSRVFEVREINTLHLNGVPVSFSDQFPLRTPSAPEFPWDGNSYQLPLFINAFSANGDQLEIDLNNDPSFPSFRARIVSAGENVEFLPSSTSLTPIPEPTAFGGFFAAGMLVWAWRRHRRGSDRPVPNDHAGKASP